jgi:hypothetical protein
MEVDSFLRLSASMLQALNEKEQEQFIAYFRKVAQSLRNDE